MVIAGALVISSQLENLFDLNIFLFIKEIIFMPSPLAAFRPVLQMKILEN